jgi:serine/threonine protein kinase
MGDMWGLGVILHELLSKTMPFDLRLMVADNDSTANMTAQTWKAVGLSAIDFVQQLLTRNPQDRIIDARQAAQHEWIRDATSKMNQVINKNLRVTKCFENMI